MSYPTVDNTTERSSNKKIIFRFSFIFITLFIIVFNNGTYPLFSYISKPFTSLMQQLVPWFAENILHYEYDCSRFINGSVDNFICMDNTSYSI